MRRLLLALALAALPLGSAGAQGMLSSKHNLSVTGPGPIKAVSETQVCVFCHTPHNASPAAPLWNRQLSGQTYNAYASSTLQATVSTTNFPNGYSKLCLSCHDGSIAIGSVRNLGGVSTTIQMTGTAANGAMPAGNTLIGINLTNDHPISFVFDANLKALDQELVDPSTLTQEIRLYEGQNPGVRDSVQCTTCHDPHLVANPKFLKKPFVGQLTIICLSCHNKPGWQGSSHYSAIGTFYPIGSGVSVADLACGACHTPHTKPGAPHLLREAATDTGIPQIQLTCYRCHAPAIDGGVTFDVKTEFAKTGSRHPVGNTAYTGHQPVFTTATPPENALNTQKHAECPDCHNPHRVTAANKYKGMRGIDLAGNVVDGVTPVRDLVEYEICFRCHSDTYATVIGTVVNGDPNGTIFTSNKRTEFQTSNSAYHPVAGPGKNTSQNLADQLSPNALATTSTIRCTDCHNNDYYSGTAFKGPVSQYTSTIQQPKGPHGSARFNLLRARYWNVLPGPSTWFADLPNNNFAVCFHCHDITRLTAQDFASGARTNFSDEGSSANAKGLGNLHYIHLINRISKARAVCKDCHYNIHSNVEASNTQYRITSTDCNGGTVFTAPNSTAIPTRLVNFRPDVITGIRGAGSKPEWCFNTNLTASLTKERRCYLQCHQPDVVATGGATMSGFGYRPPSGDLP